MILLKRLLFQNFSLAYRVGAWFRHRISPIGKLLLFIVLMSGIFGFDTRAAATYQVFTLLVSLFSFSALWCFITRKRFPTIIIERQLPCHATIGEPLYYTLTFKNTDSRIQRGLHVLDELSGESPSWEEFITAPDYRDGTPHNPFDQYVGYYTWRHMVHKKRGASLDEQSLPDLPPLQTISIRIMLLPNRRGRLGFVGPCLYRPDPFGLLRVLYRTPLPQSCYILPKRYPISPLPSKGGRTYQRGGITLANAVGESSECIALRDYRAGDSLRNVHWRSSAKFGKWVVKEYQDEYFVRRALVLDTFCSQESVSCFESAVSVAASIALAITERDALLDLMFVEHTAHCFTVGRGLADTTALLEVLAGVQSNREAPFSILAQTVLSQVRRLSSVTCILLDLDTSRYQFCEALLRTGLSVGVLLVREDQWQHSIPKGLLFRHIRPSHIATDLLQ